MSKRWPRIKGKCPICGKDGCALSPDGGAVMCWRVIDGSFKLSASGHGIHKIDENTKPQTYKQKDGTAPSYSHDQWAGWIRAAQMRYSVGPKLGESLGLSEESMKRCGVGVLTCRELASQLRTSCQGTHAWTFPMYNEHRRPIGIRLRSTTGFKYSVDGSRSGVFMDVNMPTGVDHLYVVEGASDTAAGMDLGLDVIGRPSNVGNTELIRDAVRYIGPRWTTIMIDRDEPGTVANRATWRGAYELKDAIGGKRIDIIQPPMGLNDLREVANARCEFCGRLMMKVNGGIGNVTHDGRLWCGCHRQPAI